SLMRFDTANNQLSATILLGLSPVAFAIRADGLGYVTGAGISTIGVIDTLKNSVSADVDFPECANVQCVALGLAPSADGKLVYVVNSTSNNVLVIDADKNQVASTIDVGKGPRSIAISR